MKDFDDALMCRIDTKLLENSQIRSPVIEDDRQYSPV